MKGHKQPKFSPRKVTVYESWLVVSGRVASMLDMLRYDCCFPATGEDAARMARTLVTRESATVILRRISASGTPAEDARWASFGCVVRGERPSYGEALEVRNLVENPDAPARGISGR